MLHPQRDTGPELCCTESLSKKEYAMSLSSHLQELKRKHQTLSDTVERAQSAPGIDRLRVAEMKKQKLRLKEEITKLEAHPAH